MDAKEYVTKQISKATFFDLLLELQTVKTVEGIQTTSSPTIAEGEMLIMLPCI